MVRYAQAAGDPGLMWGATFIRSWRALLDGRMDESEALAEEARRWGERGGQPEAMGGYAIQLTEIRGHQGRLGEVAPMLEQAAATYPGVPALQAMLACAYLESGRPARALELLRAGGADGFRWIIPDLFWQYCMVGYAEVAALLGDGEASAVLYDLLRPWPHQTAGCTAASRGAVALYLGMLATTLGRYDDAEAHLVDAQNLERRRAPFWSARVQVEHARLLLTRGAPGDAPRAAALVAEADACAEQYGFGGITRHLRTLAVFGADSAQ